MLFRSTTDVAECECQLTHESRVVACLAMSVLEIKQAITRLTKRERQELQAYLLRLKHNSPEWKRATAKRLKTMRAGDAIPAAALESRVRRGASD